MAGPIQLYDRSTQKWVDVPHEEVTNKVASGQYGFASGIDIPVVAPDGTLGSIPSDKAEQAFVDHGFRWQTPADLQVDNERQKQAIAEKNYGSSEVIAPLLGVARGATLGLSDVALNQAGLAPAVKGVKEQQPISSTLGEIAGTVLSPVGEAGTAIRTGVEAATAIKAGSKAAQLAAKYGSKTLGSAIEGAYYGGGQGISEAALGDPNDVAQNIYAGLKSGAEMGGLFGAGGQVLADVSPIVNRVTAATTNLFDKGISAAARKGFESTVVPAMSRAGETELAQKFGALADDPELRKAMDVIGPDKFEAAVKTAKEAEKQLAQEASETAQGLNSYISRFPAQEKAAITDAVTEAKGDLNQALKSMYDQRVEAHTNFDNTLATMKEPAQVIDRLAADTLHLSNKLKASGDAKSVNLGNTLESMLEASKQDAYTIADEVNLAKRIRQEIPVGATGLGDFAKTSRSNLIDFRANIDNYALKNHPNEFVSTYQKLLDGQDKAYFNLSQFVTKSQARPGNALFSIMKDPEQAAKLGSLLNNASEFIPEMKTLQRGFDNITARNNALKSFAQKANELKDASVVGKFSPEDMDQLLRTINGRADVIDRADRLKQISTALKQDPNMGVLDKYVAVQKSLGNPVDKTLAEYAKLEPGFKTLNQLRDYSGVANASKDSIAKSALPLLFGKLGIAYKAFDSLRSIGKNPYRSIQTLTQIEKMSNKGAKLITNGVKTATEALLNPTFQRVAKVAAIDSATQMSREERLKNFQKQREQLQQLQDPQYASDVLGSKLGVLQGASNIQGALLAHQMTVAQFLASKLPVPPVASTGPFGKAKVPLVSDADLSTFNRYVTAANDPKSIFDSIKSGHVSPEEAETVRTLYPGIFKQLQEQVGNDINKYGKEPTYQQKLMLSSLLGTPMDATMQPDFVQSMQQDFVHEEQKKQGGRPEGKSIKIDLKSLDNVATDTTRITNK